MKYLKPRVPSKPDLPLTRPQRSPNRTSNAALSKRIILTYCVWTCDKAGLDENKFYGTDSTGPSPAQLPKWKDEERTRDEYVRQLETVNEKIARACLSVEDIENEKASAKSEGDADSDAELHSNSDSESEEGISTTRTLLANEVSDLEAPIDKLQLEINAIPDTSEGAEEREPLLLEAEDMVNQLLSLKGRIASINMFGGWGVRGNDGRKKVSAGKNEESEPLELRSPVSQTSAATDNFPVAPFVEATLPECGRGSPWRFGRYPSGLWRSTGRFLSDP